MTGFTGHLRSNGTDCDVEDADLTITVAYPSYLEGEVPENQRKADENFIDWNGGSVTRGSLRCRVWSNGEFRGDSRVGDGTGPLEMQRLTVNAPWF